MRKIALVLSILFCTLTSAQTTEDQGRISIKALMPDESGLTTDASSQLETKMQRLLADNGYADDEYAARFVFTAKFDVVNKDVAPSTPARISEKFDVTFFVGDVIENKVYASTTLDVTGIGVNENKAVISAMNNINIGNKKLKDMLVQAKEKIITYYSNNCNEQITRAKTLAAIGQYDEAIANMMSVPNVCSDCFSQCQQTAIELYQQKIDAFGRLQLERARNAWIKSPNADGAAEVVSLINEISPASSIFPDVERLRNEVSAKLTADEQKRLEQQVQKWNLYVQLCNDEQANRKARIKACRDVGVAWAKNQPSNIVQTIIRGWW